MSSIYLYYLELLQLHPLKLLFIILLTLLFTRQCRHHRTNNLWRSYKNLPPSPPKLPIIGNFHQLGGHPYRSLQSYSKEYGDLMLIWLGSVPCLVVSSADAAREIMKTNDALFADRPYMRVFHMLLYGCKDIAMAPYGDYWRQMKSLIVIHLLHNSRVKSYHEVRFEEVSLMVDKIRKSGTREVNLSAMFMTLANEVVCRVAFGKKNVEEEKIKRSRSVLREFVDLIGGFYVGDFIPWLSWIHRVDGVDARVHRFVVEVDRLLGDIIQEHIDEEVEQKKMNTSKDFVDILLQLRRDELDGSAFEDTSIKAIILDVFVAGTDTSFSVLEWAMSELLKHPRVMKELQDEVRSIIGDEKGDIKEEDLEKMVYLKAVIKETMRLHPPLPLLLPRRSMDEIKLKNYDIPKGIRIFVNAWAIQRDPTYWDEPDIFSPERFLDSKVDFRGQDLQFIPFGAGRRGCPGISFATATIELTLATLMRTFDWKLPDNADGGSLDMSEATNAITLHRKIPLLAVASLHG